MGDIPITSLRRFYGLNYATEYTGVLTSLFVRIYTVFIFFDLPEALGCQWVPTCCQNNGKSNINYIEWIIFHLFVM